MGEPVRPIVERFRRLPASEKILLVQQLWDEIAEEQARITLTEPIRRLLEERIDEHEADPDDVEPWPPARDEILRELGEAARLPAEAKAVK